MIISTENSRLSKIERIEHHRSNILAKNKIEKYLYHITNVLDKIEQGYHGSCDNSLILFMRRNMFSILGGIEFGIVKEFHNQGYVVCNSWGDKTWIKVRKPNNFDGFLMTGPHKINSLGEPVYVIKKTRNNIEYNMILKLSLLSEMMNGKRISIIENNKLLYGNKNYDITKLSSIISNVKYGLTNSHAAHLPFHYQLLLFVFIFLLCFFFVSDKIVYLLHRYILHKKIQSGRYLHNVYQPIINSDKESIFSYEIFTRTSGSTNALSIMNDIRKFKLHDEHAINQIEQVKSLPVTTKVQINISVKNILSDTFYTYVSKLDSCFVKMVIFEITEDENLLLNKVIVSQRMVFLKSLGYEFAIDDYGMGYSNLSYLMEFQFDYIKIDKSIINLDKSNLLHVIKVIGSELGATCIAEGVESTEQKDMLKEMGIILHQGWYYGKPMKRKTIDCTDIILEY